MTREDACGGGSDENSAISALALPKIDASIKVELICVSHVAIVTGKLQVSFHLLMSGIGHLKPPDKENARSKYRTKMNKLNSCMN